MLRRLVLLVAISSIWVQQPAAAHPFSPGVATTASVGVLTAALDLADSGGRRVGSLVLYIHEDGVASTAGGSYAGAWFSAQLSHSPGDEIRASGPLSAGTVDIDPTYGVTINATLGALGMLSLTAGAPYPVASNVGCVGYYSFVPGPEPHVHWWLATVARMETHAAVAAGFLGSYRVAERTVYFAASGIGKIQVDVPPVSPPPFCF